MELQEALTKSKEIRELYHSLERENHGSVWSVEEDALAFLTDAGIVGRLIMSQQGRWPSGDESMLSSKIGECVWWLAILADRVDLDFKACVETFLEERLVDLKKN